MNSELPQFPGMEPALKPKEGTFHVDYQSQLDRLVDGELNQDEQRELFKVLDHTPQLWKACALAFLEARAWQQEIVAITQEIPTLDSLRSSPPTNLASISQETATAKSWKSRFRQVSPWFSLAASLLLAILVGLEVRDRWFLAPISTSVAANNPPTRPNHPTLTAPNTVLANDNHVAGSITLHEANGQPLQMPIYTGEDYDVDWMLNQPSRIPIEVRQTLERMGFRIQEQRQFVPMYIGDGQRVLVPVDQVEIHPSRKEFQ